MTNAESRYRIRPMKAADMHYVLRWRNHPNVRRFMCSQHEIDADEHEKWFENSVNDPTRHLLIFESDQQPRGFVQFKELSPGRVADWGFYTDPEAPKGTGRKLGSGALNYAFRRIGYHKVCGQALAFNDRSIKFHHSLGFVEEGVLRDQYFDGELFHDVICFGLIKMDWQ